MTRSTEQSLEEMTRSLKKISDSLDNMGRVLARYFHPSRKPERMTQIVEMVREDIPVEIDWETSPILGTAHVVKEKSESVKIVIEIEVDDQERALKLIREGFIETLGISTFRK